MNIIIQDKINYIEEIGKVLKGGHILVVYRDSDALLGDKLIKILGDYYRITMKRLPSNVENDASVVDDVMDIDDDIRMIVAVGSGSILEVVKHAASLLGIALVVILTSAYRMRGDNAFIFGENELNEYKCIAPAKVLIPTEHVLKRNNCCYLISDIAESMLSKFDEQFMLLLSGNGLMHSKKLTSYIEKISTIDENKKLDLLHLAYEIKDEKSSMATRIAYILSHSATSRQDMASYQFALTYMILLLYKWYIGYSGDDLLYPPDIVDSAELVERTYGIEVSDSIMSYKMMSSSEYMRLSHIIGEYRGELNCILESMIDTMKNLARAYRRLSRDSGYNLYGDLNVDTIERSISELAIYESDNTLLRVMKVSGFLEHYLRESA